MSAAVMIGLLACGGAGTRAPAVEAPVAKSSPARTAAGAPCEVEGKAVCADASSALLCRGGSLVGVPCQGPGGCEGRGDDSKCHDDIREEGDVCIETPGKHNYACTGDHSREVLCIGGRDELHRTCRGPKGCRVEGGAVNCDDSIGEIGDRCAPSPGDANYACSFDATTEIVCERDSRQFGVVKKCRGPRRCYIADERVYCDQSLAREGEPCAPAGNHSCSEDGTFELQCSAGLTWAKQRDCRKSACEIREREVYCR
jgi:hypothetical protein